MLRFFPLGLSVVLAACAPAAPIAAIPGPTPTYADDRALAGPLEAEVAARLGPGVLEEAARAPAAIIRRRSISLPPPGYVPSIVVAFRSESGWVRIDQGGRGALSPMVAEEVERLLATGAWRSDPARPPVTCTDGSGTIVQIRVGADRHTTAHPCGRTGDSGLIGEWVAANRITDWRDLPLERRPANLPLQRFNDRYADLYRSASGIYEERLIAIHDWREWEAQWHRITAGHGNPPGPPPVEFTTQMVLLAAMGSRPTGGYAVTIERASEERDAIVVSVTFTAPGPTCGATAALTQPADLAMIPRSDKPVRFIVDRQVRDCR